ncbi:MAG: polymerase, sigma-24 subunit, subfamily [Ignavibacteria bacterium]|nr:polymerase, sigma-24 subunit, subfamily [Ignavibacteria bacterium]
MIVNKEKFFELLEPLYERLERFALSMTRNREAARDLLGDTVLAAYDSFPGLRSEEAFLSFLFTIASRIYHKAIKSNPKLVSLEQEDLDTLFGIEPDSELLTDVRILYESLDKLQDIYKETIILFDILGFSYNEICEIQNATLPNVKVRLHRGRSKLAEIMGVNNDLKVFPENNGKQVPEILEDISLKSYKGDSNENKS